QIRELHARDLALVLRLPNVEIGRDTAFRAPPREVHRRVEALERLARDGDERIERAQREVGLRGGRGEAQLGDVVRIARREERLLRRLDAAPDAPPEVDLV